MVDALRGIAALAVVLYHFKGGAHIDALLSALPRWPSLALDHANLGVAIFFVISGFVIAHTLYDETVTIGVAARFMLRRSVRLDPAYWTAIVLAIGFGVLSTHFVAGKAEPTVTVPQLIAHLTYSQDLLGFREISPIFWTLCLEVQFYVVFVALLLLPRRLRNPSLMLCCAVSALFPMGRLPEIDGLFLTLWYGFLLGAACYWAWRQPKLTAPFLAFAALIAGVAAYRTDGFAATCAATALIIWIGAIARNLAVGDSRALQMLGAISYSLYLSHNPISGAAFRVSTMLLPSNAIGELFGVLLALSACLVAAYVMWRLIEQPSVRLAKCVRYRAPRTEAKSETITAPTMRIEADRKS